MKQVSFAIALCCSFLLTFSLAFAERTSPLIIDHTCTDINLVPDSAINQAKTQLHIAYEHTSHGSQIISGMNALSGFPEFGSKFSWGNVADDDNMLDLHDNAMPRGIDLSSGEYQWYEATQNYLNDPANSAVNVIMWSWCNISGHSIPYYLGRMEALIEEYGEDSDRPIPVQFIFMTGHANGYGENDSSDSQNRLIRQHCIEYNRILFDFADIENYDPDGKYFLDKNLDDALYYDSDNNGSRDSNWASEYLNTYPNSQLFQLVNGTGEYSGCGSCAHSPEGGETSDARLNCVLKGRAIWWLWARLTGWGECIQKPSDLNADVDGENHRVVLSWTDNSSDPNENSFIIQRRVGDGQWSENYATVDSGETNFTDSELVDGTYAYRILARLDVAGEEPCHSQPSNVITASIGTPQPPDAPGNLEAQADAENGTIALSWHDNSDDETGFDIHRHTGDGNWDTDFAHADADAVTYIDNGPLADGTYTYRVVAENAAGPSGFSNEASAEITTQDETDSDGDGVPDDEDGCPHDLNKTEPGDCGCGVPEADPCNNRPQPPSLTTPADAATDVSLTPSMTIDGFQDPDNGDTHAQTMWQISTNDDFSDLAVNETSDDQLTAFTPENALEAETTYYWRAGCIDNRGAQSEWSDTFSFTTQAGDGDGGGNSDSDSSSGCFLSTAVFKR